MILNARYGNLLIPYIVFVSSLAAKRSIRFLGKFTVVYAIGALAFPTYQHVKTVVEEYNEEGFEFATYRYFEWVFMVSGVLILFSALAFLIMFASVVAFDMRRRYWLVWFLTKLLQPGVKCSTRYVRVYIWFFVLFILFCSC